MRPRRAEVVALAAIAAALVGAAGVLPVVRALDPQLAVDAAWFPSLSVERMTQLRLDPWGRPWQVQELVTWWSSFEGIHPPEISFVPGPCTEPGEKHGCGQVGSISRTVPYSLGPDGLDQACLGDDLQPSRPSLPAKLLRNTPGALLTLAGLLGWWGLLLRLPRPARTVHLLAQLPLVAGPPLATLPWLAPRVPDLSSYAPQFLATSWEITVLVSLAGLVLLGSIGQRLAAPVAAPEGGLP